MSADRRFETEDGPPPAGARPAVRSRPSGPGVAAPETFSEPEGSPWQRIGYLLGAIGCAGMVLVLFNPYFGTYDFESGVDARLWPWEVFYDARVTGGGFAFVWREPQVFILVSFAAALGFLVAALLPPGRARGMLAITAIVLGFTAHFPPGPEQIATYPPLLVLPLAAGAIIVRVLRPNNRGAFVLLAASLVMLAAQLLFPAPAMPGTPRSLQGEYHSLGWDSMRFLVEGAPSYGGSILDRAWLLPLAPALVLTFALGMLVLFGLRGRWAAWAAGLLLVAGEFLPLVRLALPANFPADDVIPSLNDVQNGARQVAKAIREKFFAYALPLAAAIYDFMRPRPAPPGA
jgi:hypothetical protein